MPGFFCFGWWSGLKVPLVSACAPCCLLGGAEGVKGGGTPLRISILKSRDVKLRPIRE